MSKQQRNLVIYQAQKFDTELYVELAAHNWQVHVANDLQTLADLSDQHLFRVGLYFVSEKCSNNECIVGRNCLIDNCQFFRFLTTLKKLCIYMQPEVMEKLNSTTLGVKVVLIIT